MPRLSACLIGKCVLPLLMFSLVANFIWAQSETATVSGQVVDPSGLNITGAQVKLVDIDRDTNTSVNTNNTGLYTFPSVKPGRYRMEVTDAGFKVINVTGLVVNVQDHVEQNFRLQVGSAAESVTVTAGAPLVNTTDATVSTVVDRHFAENLPLNGRSFQTLIELTPGVVLTASNYEDGGQFSINGQRAASNYWMVDGVSANIGVGISNGQGGNGVAGALGSFSTLGGTNSLVSVDAMQEFRIQTSTFAPEFGRTPGGQISIVTRSGTNSFHGTAFDYLRNDILDANNWFNTAESPALPKAQERQNDFGGTFSGPILKDRTFFFFSYEGLRLRLPQTTLSTVPDSLARETAVTSMQPYLKAFPLPNGSDNPATGIGEFNASYSNPATLDAYSVRVDHVLSDNWTLFGRYNYSPSNTTQRGAASSLSTVSTKAITLQTVTVGLTSVTSPTSSNDLRINYSRTNAYGYAHLDTFGGATPLTVLPFPSPFTATNSFLSVYILSLSVQQNALLLGTVERVLQQQINIIDSVSVQRRSHSLKFGVDYRRLSPLVAPSMYSQTPIFNDVTSAAEGNPLETAIGSTSRPTFLFRNLGTYAQDTWRVMPRLTITSGVRWDVDFAPRSISGPNFVALSGFNLANLSNLALAPSATTPYSTVYGNIAPRIGVAYQLHRSQRWQSAIRGGFGIFYDLASSEAGNQIPGGGYPFGATTFASGSFPLNPSLQGPPLISPPSASDPGRLFGFDPNLRAPYTLQWNASFEQALGSGQTVSTSYVGAVGRRLLQSAYVQSPTPAITQAQLVTNAGRSDYDALQIQLQRRLSQGLQVLASYVWSHSIDTGSAGSTAVFSNVLIPSAIAASRGPSDFDIRNAFSVGFTYEIPAPKIIGFGSAILRAWSTENVIQARSAPPVDISDVNFFEFSGGLYGDVRPDLIPGQPLYLYGSQYPGGKAFNPAAFMDPPGNVNTGIPLRQGDVPRNFLRGFGAAQWDFAVHRDFPVHESLKLQFRAEMFNVLNHPNFGPPNNEFGLVAFGVATQMLGQSLAGPNSLGAGGFSPLYQIGGPRSVQFALKLLF